MGPGCPFDAMAFGCRGSQPSQFDVTAKDCVSVIARSNKLSVNLSCPCQVDSDDDPATTDGLGWRLLSADCASMSFSA